MATKPCYVVELCRNCCSEFMAERSSGRLFCCHECRKEYENRQSMTDSELYALNYNRAMEGNSKIGKAAVEARAKGMSYGKYIASKAGDPHGK